MGGQRNLIILGVAVLLGLFAVFIANSYFSGVEERQAQIAAEQKLARIVVATQPLAFGAKLTTDNVRMQNWPAASVPQGAFRSLDAALRDSRVALRPIVPGEPILADKVSGKDGRATLAANIPAGMRATTIPVTAVSGVAGFVLPATTVDVLLTRKIPGEAATQDDQMVDVIMENVQVLAVDQLVDEKTGKPKTSKTATLLTDLYGAQKLTLAQKVGTLSLALRNVDNPEPAALTTVTTRDLGGGDYRAPRRIAAVRPAMAYRPPAAPARVAEAASGPSMAVYRGVDKADYEVGQLGGK